MPVLIRSNTYALQLLNMLHKVVIEEGPAVEPLSITEANTHLHVSGQDTYVTALISVARRSIERYLKRTLITTTYTAYADKWEGVFTLPLPTLQSVESVKYYNNEGVLTTLSENENYWVVNTDDPGQIVKKYDVTYPELQDGRPDAIEIAYTAGYGDAASDVPEDIRHAMKLLIGNYYEQRSDIVVGSNAGRIPNYISDLIHSYRIYEF